MTGPVASVAFQSTLARRDFLRAGVVLALRNPLTLTAMASGPVLWAAGTLAGGGPIARLGVSLMFLVVAVPIAAVLAGSYAAYRPRSSELYEPVGWEFAEDGVHVHQDGRDAFAEWSEFTGWRKVAGCYLLHTSQRKYVVIPASAVPPERAADFEALLTGHTGRIR